MCVILCGLKAISPQKLMHVDSLMEAVFSQNSFELNFLWPYFTLVVSSSVLVVAN